MAKKVFIGVGHGGRDSGATGNGFKEKDLNLSIALACRDELVKNGVSVLMSRTKDENDPLTDEIKECNNFNPDLALDIHNNSGGGDGAEVFHYSKGGTSKILAQNILNEIVKIGQNSRGLKTKLNSKGTDYFGFIREIKAPSVIVECAFIDNKNDIKIIDTEAERKKMGVAIAHGILKTLGIAIKAIPTVDSRAKDSYSINSGVQPALAIYAAKLMLNRAGYKVDENGYIGTGTVVALKDIQKKAGLSQNGTLNAETMKAIFKLIK